MLWPFNYVFILVMARLWQNANVNISFHLECPWFRWYELLCGQEKHLKHKTDFNRKSESCSLAVCAKLWRALANPNRCSPWELISHLYQILDWLSKTLCLAAKCSRFEPTSPLFFSDLTFIHFPIMQHLNTELKQ